VRKKTKKKKNKKPNKEPQTAETGSSSKDEEKRAMRADSSAPAEIKVPHPTEILVHKEGERTPPSENKAQKIQNGGAKTALICMGGGLETEEKGEALGKMKKGSWEEGYHACCIQDVEREKKQIMLQNHHESSQL